MVLTANIVGVKKKKKKRELGMIGGKQLHKYVTFKCTNLASSPHHQNYIFYILLIVLFIHLDCFGVSCQVFLDTGWRVIYLISNIYGTSLMVLKALTK